MLSLLLPLVQEGQLSVTGKSMCSKYCMVNCLGGLSLPRESVVRLTDCPDMTLNVFTVNIKQQINNNNKMNNLSCVLYSVNGKERWSSPSLSFHCLIMKENLITRMVKPILVTVLNCC